MTAQTPPPLHIRCTIESAAYSMCKYTPGQTFDIIDGRLAGTPPNGICLYIFNNLLGLLLTRLNDPDVGEWLRSGPTTTCSDGPERTVVRLSLVEPAAA
jgi:hypothetical protein